MVLPAGALKPPVVFFLLNELGLRPRTGLGGGWFFGAAGTGLGLAGEIFLKVLAAATGGGVGLGGSGSGLGSGLGSGGFGGMTVILTCVTGTGGFWAGKTRLLGVRACQPSRWLAIAMTSGMMRALASKSNLSGAQL